MELCAPVQKSLERDQGCLQVPSHLEMAGKCPELLTWVFSPRLAALTLTYQASVGWRRAGPKPLYPLAALRLLGSHPGTQRIHTAEN